MPFNPINYGNIAAQGENILAARQRRDPNSMQNQLLAAQLQNAQKRGDPNSIENRLAQKRLDNANLTGRVNELKFQRELTNPGGTAGYSAKTEWLPGNLGVQTFDNQGGFKLFDAVGKEVTDPTAQQSLLDQAAKFKVDQDSKKAQTEISKQQSIEETKLRLKRRDEIISDVNEQARLANTSGVQVKQALASLSKIEGGMSSGVKLMLSRLDPDINVEDESVVEASMIRLTLDTLAAFKGPTTDFEYGVAQNTVGGTWDSKSANRARLKSIERAQWFTKRQAKQLQDYLKQDGATVDDWHGFDFNETIKTKKGTYTLEQLMYTAQNNHLSMEETLRELNK